MSSDDDDDHQMDTFDHEDDKLIYQAIEMNPYDMEAHLKLISSLRLRGDLEATRAARARFQSFLFPKLEIWLQLLEEEVELIAGDADKARVKSLFEVALKDYPASVELWTRYLAFCEANLPQVSVETELKKAAAFPVWNLKRGYLLLQNSNAAAYRAIPYTLQAKKAFNSDDLSGGPFDSFEETFPQGLDKYIEAVKASKFMTSADKLTLCRVLFERAIEESGNDIKVWEEYLTFLRMEMNVSTVVLGVNSRLIRAHPLNVDSWILFMENLELFNKHSDIEALWNELLPRILLESSHETFLAIQMARLDSLRRSGNEVVSVFQAAISKEQELFAVDPQARLSRYFAQVLFSQGEIDKFRNVWQQLLKEHAKEAAFWLEYLQMERTLAHVKKSQEIVSNGFKRAAVAVTDYPETIFYEWLQFERQQGTQLQSLLEARVRIDKQRKILREREAQRQQKEAREARETNEASSRKRTRVEAKTPAEVAQSETPKPVKSFNPEATLFVNNLPFKFTEKDIETHFNSFASQLSNSEAQVKSIRMHMNASGNSFKGHATIEFDSPQTAAAILERFNRQPADESGRPVFLAKYSSPLESKKQQIDKTESDSKTLFVSNLPFKETVKVEELFKSLQGIQQIRHVAGKQFAYIEFDSEMRAKEALKEISELDKTIKAAFSNPPSKSSNSQPSSVSTTFLKPRALTVKK